ncbi:MAG: hypothetical protein WD114_00550 [Phycisphaerales bacterium]
MSNEGEKSGEKISKVLESEFVDQRLGLAEPFFGWFASLAAEGVKENATERIALFPITLPELVERRIRPCLAGFDRYKGIAIDLLRDIDPELPHIFIVMGSQSSREFGDLHCKLGMILRLIPVFYDVSNQSPVRGDEPIISLHLTQSQ